MVVLSLHWADKSLGSVCSAPDRKFLWQFYQNVEIYFRLNSCINGITLKLFSNSSIGKWTACFARYICIRENEEIINHYFLILMCMIFSAHCVSAEVFVGLFDTRYTRVSGRGYEKGKTG